jgi:hypothetical protein
MGIQLFLYEEATEFLNVIQIIKELKKGVYSNSALLMRFP